MTPMQTMIRTLDAVEMIGCRHRLRPDHVPDQLDRMFGLKPAHRMKNGNKTNLLWLRTEVERAARMQAQWNQDHGQFVGGNMRMHETEQYRLLPSATAGSEMPRPFSSALVECKVSVWTKPDIAMLLGVAIGCAIVGLFWVAAL